DLAGHGRHFGEGRLPHELAEEAVACRAVAIEIATHGPPEDVARMNITIAMRAVGAGHSDIPLSFDLFHTGESAETRAVGALVAVFIHHHGLAEARRLAVTG